MLFENHHTVARAVRDILLQEIKVCVPWVLFSGESWLKCKTWNNIVKQFKVKTYFASFTWSTGPKFKSLLLCSKV